MAETTEQVILHTHETYGKVFEPLLHDVTITDGAVRLYGHMHWRAGQSRASKEGLTSMAKHMGVGEKTISNRINELEAHDWIVTIERSNSETTGNFRTPIYHVFEKQEDCRAFRASYKPNDGERMLQKPETDARKLRKGIGGNPKITELRVNRQNSASPDHRNSSSDGLQNSSSDRPQNSSSDYLYSITLDSITPKNSFASDDAISPETPQEAPEKPKQPSAKGRFTASKYYPVNEAKQEVYAKTYTPKDYGPLLDAWAKHGIVPVKGSVLNADAKYATYKLTKLPAKRSPTFDAIAECGWHMRPGFSPEVLNGNAGRVGKVITCLAEHLGKTYNEVNEDAMIAQRVRAVYAQWKVNKPNADPPKDPAAFISAWEEFTAPAPARPSQQPAPATREISADERAELARKMAEKKATLFS